jgi:shikimate kinase
MTRHVVITGLMGVGKTTAAIGVAHALALPYRDSDDDLQRLIGRTGKEIADALGVDELHRLEAALLLGALASPDRLVISAAASTVEDPMCRAALGRTAVTVVLEATVDVVLGRSAAGSHRRDIDRITLDQLADRRDPLFHEVADMIVDATQQPSDVIEKTLSFLSELS